MRSNIPRLILKYIGRLAVRRVELEWKIVSGLTKYIMYKYNMYI